MSEWLGLTLTLNGAFMQHRLDEKQVKKTIFWLFISSLVFLAGQSSSFVENWYGLKFYPRFSKMLQLASNCMPFSLGDCLYGVLIIWILYRLIRWGHRCLSLPQKWAFLMAGLNRLLQIGLMGYVLFQLFWGFNYKRSGIAAQLGLTPAKYGIREITLLTNQLIDSANFYRRKIGLQQLPVLTKPQLIGTAKYAYQTAANEFPFLNHTVQSVKYSLWTPLGDYIGFSGYFNPFTGEAQIRPDLPGILNPFIVCHEIAHQMGYASESEASFVGYLAAKSSQNPYLQYSMYLDLLSYSLNEQYLLYAKTNFSAFERVIQQNKDRMDSLVKKDRADIRNFFNARKNVISPISNDLYDQFLKLNEQLAGIDSYNEVIAWLISYQNIQHAN